MSKDTQIDFMSSFGGESGGIEVKWHELTDISQLPEAMQIIYDDINEEASYADFICYADSKGIPLEYIVGRTGFLPEEIDELLIDARRLGIYEELANNFIRK